MTSLDTQKAVDAPIINAASFSIADKDALPKGFPVTITGAKVWVGDDYKNKQSHHTYLTNAEIKEITEALLYFKKRGLDGTEVNKHNFLLPNLSTKLRAIAQDVYNGRGFALLRGLNPEKFSVEDLTIIYMGLNAHVSDMVGRQDAMGNALVHIVADKKNDKHHRHSTEPITFHTEETGDVIAWLTRGVSAEGGNCVISSVAMVYNVLAASRPDLLRVMAAGNWPFSFPRYLNRPILFNENGKVLMNFGRAALCGSAAHPRKATLPTINDQQKEALDAIEAIARATEFSFATQPGDIHFINNQAVLHRRDGFVDGADHHRHLVRMRLSSSTLGTSIPALAREWKDAFGEDGDLAFHIEPMPAGFFPLRQYPN